MKLTESVADLPHYELIARQQLGAEEAVVEVSNFRALRLRGCRGPTPLTADAQFFRSRTSECDPPQRNGQDGTILANGLRSALQAPSRRPGTASRSEQRPQARQCRWVW